MLPAVHAPDTPTTPAVEPLGPALPFAHRESYVAYFGRLAAAPNPAAAWRRLITHLDADLDGTERAALWHALWHCARRLPAADRDRVAACLDGRHAARLKPLHLDWNDPALVEHIARCTPPGAAQAELLHALLAQQGLDPLAQPTEHGPALVLLAVRSAVQAVTPRLGPDRIEQLQVATVASAERQPSLLPEALALLFELALHARDEHTATAGLAELIQQGHADLLRADRVRQWLDGTAFSDEPAEARPLQLAPVWQGRWLQPRLWRDPGQLQALHDAVQRPAVRQRLLHLAHLLTPGRPDPAPVPRRALQALQALDSAWALVDHGGDAVPAVAGLLQPDVLAPVTLSALYASSARWHAAHDDTEAQVLSLLQARRHQADPALRATLAALLPGPTPAFGPDWREEQPYWEQLLQHADARWRRLATFQLATLHTEGLLEPRPPRRCQDLRQAHALWLQLTAQPLYADAARSALNQPAQILMRPALRRAGGVDHLWFDTPGAQGVTIVFSCIATHHTFAEVAALRGRLPGQHLMFVRCPDKDWYSDRSFDGVRELLRTQVQARFAAGDVTCWYGSMGGHGALKFALEFGWRAIVFNPQTDLDLWAAFRPRERALLWGAEQHARLDDWPLAAWEQAPLYLACGAATADREALSFVIERLRRCRHASVIIEKFADDNHAGLMNRIAGGPVAPVLAAITQRLKQLADGPDPGAAPTPDPSAQAAFWDHLDAARSTKVEVQVRKGCLWWQASRATGTRP